MEMKWKGPISSGMISIEFDRLVENRSLAICVEIDRKKYWLPKSQIDFREWSKFVEIPEWLAVEKGIV